MLQFDGHRLHDGQSNFPTPRLYDLLGHCVRWFQYQATWFHRSHRKYWRLFWHIKYTWPIAVFLDIFPCTCWWRHVSPGSMVNKTMIFDPWWWWPSLCPQKTFNTQLPVLLNFSKVMPNLSISMSLQHDTLKTPRGSRQLQNQYTLNCTSSLCAC